MPRTITKAEPAFVSRSVETGTDYRILVDAPDGADAGGPWAAVLLMDGDFFFDAAVDAARSLRRERRIPPTLIAGVGYGFDLGKPGNFRGRDYTPTESRDEPSSGGADRFLGYLCGTLWPELARRYPLRETGRVIAGHSLGSLLVLHALFQRRPFFDLALASAPSIWWDDRSILRLISDLRGLQDALPGHLYLGVGDRDTPSMTGDVALLCKQLGDRPFKGLRTDCERFAGFDHYDVVPRSMAAGLASLLG